MGKYFQKYNVQTTTIQSLLLMFLLFATDNPILLGGVFLLQITLFVLTGGQKKILLGIRWILPFFLLAFLLNLIFLWEGSHVLWTVFGKPITLEALIFAGILGVKLLLVMYLFLLLELLIDSDRALSYFSEKIPKSTLMIMIALKLIPTMKKRLASLREVYITRGVNFQGKSLKEKIRGNLPILSILLEHSLDGAFDIGEAAYVRGFLAGGRSIYLKETIQSIDRLLMGEALLLLGALTFSWWRGWTRLTLGGRISLSTFLNPGIAILVFLLALIGITHLGYSRILKKEAQHYDE